MADIVITVPIKQVFREVARRTSVATKTDPFYAQKTTEEKQYSQLQGEGDRITSDFTKEAAKEVLKAFLSRQGDVVGLPFEYDSVITVAVKQKETVSVTGNGGVGYVTETAGLTLPITNNIDDLSAALGAFVDDNAAAYLTAGVVVTADDTSLIFEATVAGVPFAAPLITAGEGDIAGTTTHTTANVVGVTAGNIVYRFGECVPPLAVNHTRGIKERLENNTRDAIIYYVLVGLYRTDGNQVKEAEVLTKALSLIDELSGDLYRLHD